MTITEILSTFNIQASNPGAYANGWLDAASGRTLDSLDPSTGELIASVRQADAATYERVAATASEAFQWWRTVPAPKRGEVVHELGNALRAHKEPLGRLVSLEMGKILAEGLGEVQEMIDICDFAVGLSRQLYGLTMHSERPRHRMYEQWHPLGPVGSHHRLQLPGGGLGLERGHRRGLRRHRDLEALLLDAADAPSPSSTSPTR